MAGRDGAQAVHRVAALLRETAAARGEGVPLHALAAATGLTPPTAHRLLQALVQENLVARDEATRSYRPGPLLYELGLAAAPVTDLRRLCQPTLLRVAAGSGDSTYLTVRSGLDALCLDRREGGFPIKAVPLDVGNRRPLGVGAGAVAVLAAMPAAEAEAAIAANAARYPRYRLTADQVRVMLDAARRYGFSVSTGRFVARYRGVAVPVAAHGLAASIAVTAISERLTPPRLKRVAQFLQREARTLAALLARSTPDPAGDET